MAINRQSDDQFGTSVSVAGNVLVVGTQMHGGNGFAYIYEKNESNSWVHVATFTGPEFRSYFGASVATNGNTVVIGAYQHDASQGASSGSAWIYEKNTSNNWVQVAILEGDSAFDHFGESVDIDGNVMVIGSYYDNDMAPDSGSAYVYEKNESNDWVKVAKLMATDGSAGDQFSWGTKGVAVSGNVIVIGSWLKDATATNSGAAYVFEKNTSNTWVHIAQLLPDNYGQSRDNGNADDWFGYSVAVSGNVVVIGAYMYDSNQQPDWNDGAAYVFEKNQSNDWVQVARLTHPDMERNGYFGSSVSISGNTIIVGAYKTGNTGAVYVFQKNGSDWEQVKKIVEPSYPDYFGVEVSISPNGEHIAVGANYDDNRRGSAYVFE